MKIAKVITTSFISRTIRDKTCLSGRPLGNFSHSQNFTTPESIIDLIKYTLNCESKIDPGCKVDLIFVNNQVGYELGDQYLDSINDTKTKNGIIKIIHRENIGRSCGGYNAAVKLFGSKYDYYIFTEDDILINGNNYASIAINTFEGCSNCGFVAYQSISDQFLDRPRSESLHAHGGVGLTSYKVLEHVLKKYGDLPYSKSDEAQS